MSDNVVFVSIAMTAFIVWLGTVYSAIHFVIKFW